MSLITIPNPFHICVDDVGWFCGRDDRKLGGPSRTGIGRFHTAEDYIAIEELGKAVGMKLSCGFVLGEWDMKDTLSELPYFSCYGDKWQNSKYRDKKQMEEIAEIINSSPHIDFVMHALSHGYYKEGVDNYDSSDIFYRINKKLYSIPKEEIKEKFSRFFSLMEYHKIKKQVNQFIPPSFTYCPGEIDDLLKSFGITYISTIFKTSLQDLSENGYVFTSNGVTVVDRNNNPIPWDATDSFAEKLDKTSGILGIHWPNFLHKDSKQNDIAVANAAKYINYCCSQFDTVAAEDITIYAMQQLVLKYGKITESDSCITVDLSSIPDTAHGNFFLVNSKKPLKSVLGGSFEEYKKYNEHITYKIIPHTNTRKVVIL